MSYTHFCNMVHLAPLTPAWPADLFGGGANINRKNRATVYNHVHTTCAQYIIMNAHSLALAQCASPRRMRLATKVNNVLPVQIRKYMENVTPSCRLKWETEKRGNEEMNWKWSSKTLGCPWYLSDMRTIVTR